MESYLLRPSDRKRCCLGQVLGDNGVPDSVLRMAKSPAGITDVCPVPAACSYLVGGHAGNWNSGLCGEMMVTNDTMEITADEREQRLTALFARAGVEVEFYDGPPAV